MSSKSVENKKGAPKLAFFNEKKIEKDSDIENWVWKSHFGTFWQLCESKTQNSTISFEYVDSYAKILETPQPILL